MFFSKILNNITNKDKLITKILILLVEKEERNVYNEGKKMERGKMNEKEHRMYSCTSFFCWLHYV